jgi:DNA-directed RNA polymerase specialized sigma24 family protein
MFVATRSEKEAREVRDLAEAIYRESQSYLLRIAFQNAACRRDGEEAVSEAFAAFLRAYQPSRGAPPLAWLTLTVKRECWRRRRDAHLDCYVGSVINHDGEERSVLDVIPAPGAGLEERIAERDQARRRLSELKPNERTGLGLLGAGFSYREIGRLKGWTFTKVNRCIREGRAALATA